MKLGGQVIYAGPLGRNSRSLVDYFEVNRDFDFIGLFQDLWFLLA